MDVAADFALPLPMTVIADVLGVPPARMADFKRWSDAFTKGVGALDLSTDQVIELFGAVDEFYDYFTEQIEQRRIEPRDDLLTNIVEARLDGEEPLTVNEMLHMLSVFLVGGNETTANLLTSMVYRLLTDDELNARVRADPTLIPRLAEEMVRLETPVQGLFRTATVDTEIGGVKIPADSMLWIVFRVRESRSGCDRPARRHRSAQSQSTTASGVRSGRARVPRGLNRTPGSKGRNPDAHRALPDLRLADTTPPPVHPSFILHGLRRLDVEYTPG